MLAVKLLAVLCVASARQAVGFQIGGAYQTSGIPLKHRYTTATCSQRQPFFRGPRRNNTTLRGSHLGSHRGSHREGFVLQRGGLYLGRLLLKKSWLRPQSGSVSPAILQKQLRSSPFQSQQSQQSQLSQGGDGLPPLSHSGALVALPLLGRLFAQASNLFQVGVLFGTVPTLLAGLVCCYWAWQVIVVSSRDYQSKKVAEGIKSCRLSAAKVGPGSPGFVDRLKILDADALRAEVESRYNPTLLVHGERGSGKTVAVRLALHATFSVVHVKLWGKDLGLPLKALAQGIIDASGVDVTSSVALVAEDALRCLKGAGWGIGGATAPIVVVELDKRCTASQLQGVLLACKRWGDDENLAKFVVEAPSARIARGLPISLSDLRVEGVKMRPLAPKEALQVARGCIPMPACRDWTGGRRDDLAKYIVSKVGFGMLDLVRVGFAARNARDPLALHAAVDSFANREARAARGGVTSFLAALQASEREDQPDVTLVKRLWQAMEGAAAVVEGRKGRNPGLDEVLETVGVSEIVFEGAARGVGPSSPVAVDPFSYKVVVRSAFFKDALKAAAADDDEEEEEVHLATPVDSMSHAQGILANDTARKSGTVESLNKSC